MTNDLAQQFDLTEKQALLIEGILQGKGIEQAKREAGYAETTLVGRMIRSSPAMAEAIEYEIRRRLQCEGAPLAYKLLVEVVQNDKYGERVRVDAARTLLDRAGYLPPTRSVADDSEKLPNEMTVDELRARAERLGHEIAERARLVNSVGVEARDSDSDGVA